jgi:hypothetical protein
MSERAAYMKACNETGRRKHLCKATRCSNRRVARPSGPQILGLPETELERKRDETACRLRASKGGNLRLNAVSHGPNTKFWKNIFVSYVSARNLIRRSTVAVR